MSAQTGRFRRLKWAIVAVAICAATDTAVAATPRKFYWRAPARQPDRRIRAEVESWREIQRKNVVMQERDYSCGTAALATVLKYHWGDSITETQLLRTTARMLTLEELRERIENGLSLTDLRRVAVKTGYLASIGRLEFDKLAESKVPLIVGIVVEGYDHFVVVRGTDCDYVYLADPARGNVRTPIPKFLKQWQKNLVLVVVKKGVKASEVHSPLQLQPWETMLGETNRLYTRDRVTTRQLAP